MEAPWEGKEKGLGKRGKKKKPARIPCREREREPGNLGRLEEAPLAGSSGSSPSARPRDGGPGRGRGQRCHPRAALSSPPPGPRQPPPPLLEANKSLRAAAAPPSQPPGPGPHLGEQAPARAPGPGPPLTSAGCAAHPPPSAAPTAAEINNLACESSSSRRERFFFSKKKEVNSGPLLHEGEGRAPIRESLPFPG